MNMTDNMIAMIAQAVQANPKASSNQNADGESGMGFQNLLEGKKTVSQTEGTLPLMSEKDEGKKEGTADASSMMDYLFQALALGQMSMDFQTLSATQAGNFTGDLPEIADFSLMPLTSSVQGTVPVMQTETLEETATVSMLQPMPSTEVATASEVQPMPSTEVTAAPVMQETSTAQAAVMPVMQETSTTETAAAPVTQSMASMEVSMPQENAVHQAVSAQQQGSPVPTEVPLQDTTSARAASATAEQPAFTVVSTQNTLSLQQPDVEKQSQQDAGTQSETMAQPHQNKEQVTVSTASSQPLFEQMESVPIKVGDPQPLDTTSGDFEAKLAGKVSQALKQGTEQIEIQLAPENLGNVTVKLTRNEEGVLHVVLYADNGHAARLLEEHSSALGMMLQNSGQGEVQIEVPQPRQEEQLWQQPDQQQGQNQGGQPREQRQNKQNSDDFLQQIRLGLFQMEAQQV